MWKRLKGGKKSSSDVLFPQESSPSEQFSTSCTTESPDHVRHSSLPESTLAILPKGYTPERRKSALSAGYDELFLPKASTSHLRQRSQDRRDDPLGLIELHVPADRTADILLIHGLGGTSLRTWCHSRDPDNLWPQLWLPAEIPTARVLTFGYNAHFSSKEHSSLVIGDFANDLLFRMKYGENGPHRLGQVPIIVVAHSMGGLVFKKAYVQGHINNEFKGIISQIKAALFLATPHRGTDLAGVLNKVLASSVFGHTSKDYVSELVRRSPTIDDINESFRHHATNLQLFSFYETMNTSVGPVSTIIVDKNSSVMGYHNETQQPLIANHHNVCKFTGVDDPNYASVVGALRSVAGSTVSFQDDTSSKEDLQHLKSLLDISGPPDDDLSAGRAARRSGTCKSFVDSPKMKEWLDSNLPQVLWAHAPPGSGKSTLCSFVVDHLLENGRWCAYYFFKHGKRHHQSLGGMLRSMAYQTALYIPRFRQALVRLAISGTLLRSADAATIWRKVFVELLSTDPTEPDIYWVIDGVDETESSKALIQLMSSVADFECRFHILVFGRPLYNIRQSFQLVKKDVSVVEMALPNNQSDIRLVVAEEVDYLPSDKNFKSEMVEQIAARSQGNFLWASLVLKRVVKCLRQEQVQRVLDSTPDGMDELYDRMLEVVIGLDVEEDKKLARILLSCSMHAKTPLTVEEFSEIYSAELGSIMDLKHVVNQVCGQLVVINSQNKVTLVHHSAREYLKRARHKHISLSLDSESAHEELFGKCLVTLCDRNLRTKINTLKISQFLHYASTSWAFHLGNSSAGSDRIMDALVRFFGGPFTLPWIQYLAMSNHLSELFAVSRKLTTFIRHRRQEEAKRSPLLHRLTDLLLIETWAVDLMKIPAKFGRYLLEDPSLIYKCIPPLSPTASAIYGKFSKSPMATIAVSGVSKVEWDDCLARVSAGGGRVLRVAASSLYLAAVSDVPKGSITVWNTTDFQEHKTFDTGEHIWALAFSGSGSFLSCYGINHTFVWNIHDGSVALKTGSPSQERAIEFKFDEKDSLMMISDLRRVYKLPVGPEAESSWMQLNSTLLEEQGVPEGTFLSTPSSVAFNHDCTQIAVAYRSFPLSIWNIDPPEMVARLRRKARHGQGASNSYTGDNKVVWHPSGTQVIGIYGQIFKWGPFDDSYDEVRGDTGVIPHGLQCSPNGQVFITTDVEGSIKIYDVASMSLLYRLTSEDSINQICISPDSTRFYDLRGLYCNIWEPNCLARIADAALERLNDTDSTTDSFWSDAEDTRSTSISFSVSESHADSKPAITTMAAGCGPGGLIAYSLGNGTVEVYDPTRNSRHVIAESKFGMGIEYLAWNKDLGLLTYSLLNGASTVKSITITSSGEPELSSVVVYGEKRSPKERGRTRQLLFNKKGDLLLIYGARKCQILSLPSGEILAETETVDSQSVVWKQHPSKPGHLLCFSNEEVILSNWQLEKEATYKLDASQFSDPPSISGLLNSYSSRYVLLHTTWLHLNRPRYGFFLVSTEKIYKDGDSNSQDMISPIKLSESVNQMIEHPVGVLADGQLLFLDKDLWVCTVHLRSRDEAVTRHFFLPRDWVTASGLRLCQALEDGTFICPSHGEIAVIKSSLVFDW